MSSAAVTISAAFLVARDRGARQKRDSRPDGCAWARRRPLSVQVLRYLAGVPVDGMTDRDDFLAWSGPH